MAPITPITPEAFDKIEESLDKQSKLSAKGATLLKQIKDLLTALGRGTVKDFDKLINEMKAVSKATAASKAAAGTVGKKGGIDLDKAAIAKSGSDAGSLFAKMFGKSGKMGKGNAILTGTVGLIGEASKEMDVWGRLFKGVIKDEWEYMSNMRQIGFVTQGITSETNDLQEAFQDMGSGLRAVQETGQDLTTNQRAYAALVRQGSKANKETLRISKTSLALGTLIGGNAEDTAAVSQEMTEIMGKWNRELSLGSNQISDISRGIQATARGTGLMGKELTAVVKSMDVLMKDMRNANTLTASAAKAMIALAASAHKLGVGESMEKLQAAMVNPWKLLNETSAEDRNYMMMIASRMGKTNQLLAGTMGTTKGFKEMAGSAKTMAENIAGMSFDQLEKLSKSNRQADKERMMQINQALMKATGRQFGQMQQEIKAWEEAGKTFAQKSAEMKKALKEPLSTSKKKKLTDDLNQAGIVAAFDLMTQIEEATASTKDLGKATKEVLGDKKFAEDLKALEIDVTKLTTAPMEAFMETAMRANKGMKGMDASARDFSKDIAKVAASGDLIAMKDLLENMSVENDEIMKRKRKGVTPEEKALDALNQINGYLREEIGPWVRYLSGAMIALELIGGLLGGAWGLKTLYTLIAGKGALGGVVSLAGGAGGLISKIASPITKLIPFLGPAGPLIVGLAALGAIIYGASKIWEAWKDSELAAKKNEETKKLSDKTVAKVASNMAHGKSIVEKAGSPEEKLKELNFQEKLVSGSLKDRTKKATEAKKDVESYSWYQQWGSDYETSVKLSANLDKEITTRKSQLEDIRKQKKALEEAGVKALPPDSPDKFKKVVATATDKVAAKDAGKNLDKIGDAADAATTEGSIYVHDIALEKILSSFLMGPNESAASVSSMPMLTEGERAEKMQQGFKLEGEGDNSLTSIAKFNEEQVVLLSSINEGIQLLANLWKPSSAKASQTDAGGSNNTGSPGRVAADYGRWPVLQSHGASTGVIANA
jgi:hypothetical protein